MLSATCYNALTFFTHLYRPIIKDSNSIMILLHKNLKNDTPQKYEKDYMYAVRIGSC